MWQWLILALALVVILGVGLIVWQNTQVPTLGHERGELKPLGNKPNGVSTQSQDPKKRVDPWPFKADLAGTRAAVLAAVKQYGGAEIVEDSEQYIRVVFTTPTLHFHDDAEFYLNQDTRLVHFRSQSRAGHSDGGLNRKRFEALTDHYQSIQ